MNLQNRHKEDQRQIQTMTIDLQNRTAEVF